MVILLRFVHIDKTVHLWYMVYRMVVAIWRKMEVNDMARPSKYEAYVKPYIEDIKKWTAAGATDQEIASALGVALSSLSKYKTQYVELSDAFARGRVNVVLNIKAALLKKALGFNYEEKKQYIKKDESGEKVQYTEITTRYSVPSETAAAMLLRNYDSEWNDRDNISNEMRKQELELRKAIARSNNFDLDLEE